MQFGCLLSKNSLECFVYVATSKQDFNGPTFPFMADTELHVNGNLSKIKILSISVGSLTSCQFMVSNGTIKREYLMFLPSSCYLFLV